jgi:hypothetical protein
MPAKEEVNPCHDSSQINPPLKGTVFHKFVGTSTGPNSFARPQADVDYQRQLDLELREQSRQVVKSGSKEAGGSASSSNSAARA